MKSLKLKVGQNSLWKFKRLKQILYALLQPLHLMPKGLQKALSSQHFYNFQLNINASVVHAWVGIMHDPVLLCHRKNERNAILSTQSLRQLCSICKCATAEHRPRPVARVSDILFQVHKACETSNFFERILSWISDFKPDHASVFMIKIWNGPKNVY